MNNTQLPLKVLSVFDLYNGESAIYEVPIYQRNYAWEKEEISALVHDVYNAISSKKENYYIGTLVSFYKGDRVYEVIDGQQRLTTIFLLLHSLGVKCKNPLTYRARKKACNAIESLNNTKDVEEKDFGIMRGASYAEEAIKEIVPQSEIEKFKSFFQRNVRLVHYQVPRDIDLNHYFEIMNSRGEQLEMSEVIKARLMEHLNDSDRAKFNQLWECCSEMNTYIQQKYYNLDPKGSNKTDNKQVFSYDSCFNIAFVAEDFDDLPEVSDSQKKQTIDEVLSANFSTKIAEESNKTESFQPILDFPNFLLLVLKLTRIQDPSFAVEDFILDDKELLNQFDKVDIKTDFVKEFAFNLLKSKFFLDNYIIHHSCEDDTIDNNPWKLQFWKKDPKGNFSNLSSDKENQDSIVHLLSMFEVSFTPRQRKNYLFYCMLYLFENYGRGQDFLTGYKTFLNNLADKYFWDVYMVSDNLNEINVPRPGCFDKILLPQRELNVIPARNKNKSDFITIYGDGNVASKGIPLFVFNYLDYKIWLKYSDSVRGERLKKGHSEREAFFNELGCSDFDLRYFDQFYFSRTRRSLEHYFPQANVSENGELPNVSQINCLGNYAMIGSEANSSGSNWSPKTKLDHYLDNSEKIRQVSVASLKFIIMMQICRDNQSLPDRNNGREWIFTDIQKHQSKMLEILLQ